jgi:hypothetical protein
MRDLRAEIEVARQVWGTSAHLACGRELPFQIAGSVFSRLAPGARFGHDHEVFELQKVFELGSLGRIRRGAFGEINEPGDAGLGLFRRTECVHLLGRFAGHSKVDDFVAGSCRLHDQSRRYGTWQTAPRIEL